MCTIITADSSINKIALTDRLLFDAEYNTDGFTLLAILSNARPLVVRSMDVNAIVNIIHAIEYDRVFIHTRMATQGAAALQNTHGWNSEGTFVFHNGSIRSKIARKFEVDSQAITYWLDNYGLDETLDKLLAEPFANVFLVDIDNGSFVVHRSEQGSLFTDGKGNYSSNAFGAVKIPIEHYSWDMHEFYCENFPERNYTSRSFKDFDDFTPYKYAWDSYETTKKACVK